MKLILLIIFSISTLNFSSYGQDSELAYRVIVPEVAEERIEREIESYYHHEDDVKALSSLIENYNDSWIRYINENVNEIYEYIVPNSEIVTSIESFQRGNYTEELLGISIEKIEINKTQATLDVQESIRKDYLSKYVFKKYFRQYKAVYDSGEWKLLSYKKLDHIPLESSGNTIKLYFHNDREVISLIRHNDWIVYSNENDMIQTVNTINGNESRIGNEHSVLVSMNCNEVTLYNSVTNELRRIDLHTLNEEKIDFSIRDRENSIGYIVNFTSIYEVGLKSGESKLLYSRMPSGVDMYGTKFEHPWLYFEVISEEGLSKNRVNVDTLQYEHISTERLD